MKNELNLFISDLKIFLKNTQGFLKNNSGWTYQDDDIIKKLYEDL